MSMISSDLPPSKSPPITRLPNELLTSVFAMVANLEEDITLVFSIFGLRNGIQMFMKWVRLMLVCRHWRDVGISCPRLWRRISLTGNSNSLQYRLSRAVGCTIDVFLSGNAAVNESAMPLLLSFASNIRSIQTRDSFCFDALPSIKPLFDVSLPSLESVALSPEYYTRSPNADDDSGKSEEWFDLGLSSQLLPRLRKLEIRRIAIPPPPAFFTTLRELIINMESLENPPLRVEDVFEILAHSPRLEALKLVSWPTWDYPLDLHVPANAHVDPARRPRYNLPCLREVHLSCPYHFAAAILQVVDAPDLSLFRADVFMSTPIVADQIGDHIFPPSLRHFVHRLTSLRIVPSESCDFHICGTVASVPGRSRHNRDCFWAEIAVRAGEANLDIETLDAALNIVCSAFADAPLTLLNIADFAVDYPSRETWQRLDATFPALDTLRVACSDRVAMSFLNAFVASSMEGSWLGLRRLNISTALQRSLPLDSCELHDVFALVLDALRARSEHNADTVLGLEHMVKTSAPLAAHRWMLHSISSLCGGKFGFRTRTVDSRCFEAGLSGLFKSAEWGRLSAESPPEEKDTTGASEDKVSAGKDTIRTDRSAEGAAPEGNGDEEIGINGAMHSDDKGITSLYVGEEYEREEYSTSRSAVMEELLEIVPRG